MKVNEANWKELLESLGFTEEKNCSFGGMVVYNDDKIPMWTYETDEEKYKLSIFFKGCLYWSVHTMNK